MDGIEADFFKIEKQALMCVCVGESLSERETQLVTFIERTRERVES